MSTLAIRSARNFAGVGFVLAALLFAPAGVGAVTARELFHAFASENYAERFEAVMGVVLSVHTLTDSILAEAIEDGFFDADERGMVAAEFVRLERSGALAPAAAQHTAARGGNNFILISIDTLRADHLGCYGYERGTSPAIDALAERGAVFLNAVSPSSWTLPTHMSIFTSLYPSFHKLDLGGRLGSNRLDGSEVTLPEWLETTGYTNVGIVAHPFLSGEWGFARGFDFYRRYGSGAVRQGERARLWLAWHQFQVDRGLVEPDFFLFLHFIDPHETYDPPARYQRMFAADYQGNLRPTEKFVTLFAEADFASAADRDYAVSLYDGEIRFVDDALAPVFDFLREGGWEQSTTIILTSDHGEEFKDHGSMGHKNTLYREQLAVPLIVVSPNVVEPAQRIDAPVSLLDIFPTIADLRGKEPPAAVQGQSLLSALRRSVPWRPTDGRDRERHLFAELGPADREWERDFYRRAVRQGSLKLIYNYEADGSLGKELYDLDQDPREQRDVYPDREGLVAVRALEARLVEFIREGDAYNAAFRRKNRIEIDEPTQERLRALGYVR